MGVLLPIPPLALAVAGLEPSSVGLAGVAFASGVRGAAGSARVDLRAAIDLARKSGYRGLVLDATDPQTRPRDLDQSARREIGSLLRRHDLACAGVDVFVPVEHFTDAARVDRAVSAVIGAIELAGDLGGGSRVVNVTLPEADALGVRSAVQQHASRLGVRVADFSMSAGATGASAPSEPDGPIGVGVDTAALLIAGHDPIMRCAALAGAPGIGGGVASASRPRAAPLVCVRVIDVSRSLVGMRVAPGSADGKLDAPALAATLGSLGYAGPAVVDLRGVRDQARAAVESPRAWGAGVR